MTKEPDHKEVLTPEVLPPENKAGTEWREPRPGTRAKAGNTFIPILGGLLIDAIHLVSMGPRGFVIGALACFWICSINRQPFWQRLVWSIVAGYYCLDPFTRFLPLATLVGACLTIQRLIKKKN